MMIIARAPLRLSLGGGGTDIPDYYSKHGGYVVAAAINCSVTVVVQQLLFDRIVRLFGHDCVESPDISMIPNPLMRHSLQLLNVAPQLNIGSFGEVPSGTGLGSSGAFLVALLAALYRLQGKSPGCQDLAETAFHIERNLAGAPIGKQDSYVAACGGVIELQIDTEGIVSVRPIPVTSTFCADFRQQVLLFYTGIRRDSSGVLAEQFRGVVQGSKSAIDNLHQTKELGIAIRHALERNDLDLFGDLLDVHWQTKRRRAEAISNPEIDGWYKLAREAGVRGGKLIGAGGGGFLMLCCAKGCADAVRKAMTDAGLLELSYDFSQEGVRIVAEA